MRWRSVLAVAVVAGAMVPGIAAGQVDTSCTAGSSGIGDPYFPYMGNGGYDVQNYTLDLDLDVPNGAIRQGTATIQALATDDLCRFNLDLNGLEVDRVTVNGNPAGFSRRGQELIVAFDFRIPAGTGFVTEIRYHGTPFTLEAMSGGQVQAMVAALEAATMASPVAGADAAPAMATPVADLAPGPGAGADAPAETAGHAADGTLTIGESADTARYGPSLGGWWTAEDQILVAGEPRGAETWFPVNGHPVDKASYTFRLTTDEPFRAVANGELVEVVDNGDTVTSTFVARDPMASYLATLYAGKLEIVNTLGADGQSFRYAYGDGVPAWQRESLEAITPQVVDRFSQWFGPYPFAVAGGMVPDISLFFALETQTIPIYGVMHESEPYAGRDVIEPIFEEVIAHELAHQWFGNSASVQRWQDIALSEGLTQYAMYLWIGERDGQVAIERRLKDSYDMITAGSAFPDLASVEAANGAEILAGLGLTPDALDAGLMAQMGIDTPDALADLPGSAVLDAFQFPAEMLVTPPLNPLGDPGADQLFSSMGVYERGALMVHALRRELGEEAFWVLMNVYPETFRHGNASVGDLRETAEIVSGRDLGPFFAAWFDGTELPPMTFDLGEGTPAATPQP